MHLAHALVRYLGLSSPADLAPYGIHSPGDLVDLLSRVSRLRPRITSRFYIKFLSVFYQHDNTLRAFADTHRARSLTLGSPLQPFL